MTWWTRAPGLVFGLLLALCVAPVPVAAEVNQWNGSFSHAIPIEVPPYHGIEPRLALTYDSGAGNGFAGVGWSLTGFSTIERASPGKGAPRYDGTDVYLLDGQELVPCTSLGGTHCTKVQSFQRIVYDAASNSWTITAKDGTRATYGPVYVVTQGTFRWGLTTVTDTSGNSVAYNWRCLAGDCYPWTLVYNGIYLTFFPEGRPDTLTFATGSTVGRTAYRLRSVFVYIPGVSHIRAYRLSYAASAATARSVLTSVQMYGRDVTHDGNGLINGGTSMPPLTFGSSPAVSGFAADATWATGGYGTPDQMWVADVTGDGKSDLVYRSATTMVVKRSTGSSFVEESWGWGGAGGPGYTWTADVNGDGKSDVVYQNGAATVVRLSTGVAFQPDSTWLASGGYGAPEFMWMADVNGDGKSDVVYQNGAATVVKLSTGTAFQPDSTWLAFGGYGSPGLMWPADVNGDGKADLVFQNGAATVVKLSTGTAFQADEVWGGAASGGVGFTWTADVNGDGKADFVYQSGATTYVRLSTGGSFLPDQAWASGGAGGRGYMWTDDVNDDGRADIVYQYGATTYVKLSTGGSFLADQAWASGGYGGAGYMWTGDVDGDGKSDVVYQSGPATVVKVANRGAPDLLTSLGTGLGGTTTITYAPSTAWWPSANNPPITQTVMYLLISDGRGDVTVSSYRYQGGKYDRAERTSLGFQYATKDVSCATTATNCNPFTARPFEERWFQQDVATASKTYDLRISTRAGVLLSRTWTSYPAVTGPPPYNSLPIGEQTLTYDGSGNLTCPSSSCRRTYVKWTYDGYGNVTRATVHGDLDVSGDEQTTVYTYAPNPGAYVVGKPAAVAVYPGLDPATAAPFSRAEIWYDGATTGLQPPIAGRPTRQLRWLDTTNAMLATSLTYDAYGNVETQTDPVNGVTRFAYDPNHHIFPVTITDPLNHVTTFEWDRVCALRSSLTDPTLQKTTFTYDALCRPVRTTMPLGAFETRAYVNTGDPGAQYVEVATPSADGNGPQWVRTYVDGLGRTWRTVRKGPAAGQDLVADVVFNMAGGVDRQSSTYYTGASPTWTRYAYDELGRLTRVTYPGGSAVGVVYGARSITFTDEGGHATVDTLDGYGRVVNHREFLGGVAQDTVSAYDAAGNMVGRRDSAGNRWSWTYDSLQRLVSRSDPDIGTWFYTYDDAGRPRTQTDAKRQVTLFEYNPLHQLTSKTTSFGTPSAQTVTYGYDVLGRINAMVDGSGRFSAGYDALGRMTWADRTIDGTLYRMDKGYDAGGRLLWTFYSSPTENDWIGSQGAPLRYDGAGRLSAIPGFVNAALYDAEGRLTQQNNANGSVTYRAYDNLRPWLTSLVTVAYGRAIQNLAYEHDAEGKIMRIISPFAYEGWSYGYDELHRLTSATSASGTTFDRSYTYDALGNMTWSSRLGAYTYPLPGQPRPHAVQRAGAGLFTYDANGNMESGNGRTITWDPENRPAKIDGTTFAYDGLGQRIRTTDGSTTTHFLGDDYEVTNGTVTKYVELAGVKVAKVVGGTTYWLHTDHQGSVQAVTNGGGNLVERQHYEPYGERLELGLSPRMPDYTGERADATGLLYLHARYYDPVLGRFLSPDPTVPSRLNVGLNRYAYAGNDPVDHVDRDGLSWLSRTWKKIRTGTKKFVHWAETRKPLPTNTRYAWLNKLNGHLDRVYGKNIGVLLESSPFYPALTGDLKGWATASAIAGLYVGSYLAGGWPLVALEVLGIPFEGPGAKDLDHPQKGLEGSDAPPGQSSDGSMDPEYAHTGNDGQVPPTPDLPDDFGEGIVKQVLKRIFKLLAPKASKANPWVGAAEEVTKMNYEKNAERCQEAWGPPQQPTIGAQSPGTRPATPDDEEDSYFFFGPCGTVHNKM